MNTTTKYKKIFVILVTALALAAGVILFIVIDRNNNSPKSSALTPIENTNSDSSEEVNLNPPTEQEKTAGDKKKQEISDRPSNKTPSENQDNKKTADVIVSYAAQDGNSVEVNAFISNHLENGECTLELTKDNEKVSKTSPAYADASTTICTNLLISTADLPLDGVWQGVVTYTSENAYGQSNKFEVNVN